MKTLAFAINTLIFFYYNLAFVVEAQESKDKSFNVRAAYLGANVGNFSGGIKTGFAYLGMANVCLSFDVENAGLWKGGQFYLNAVNTHGTSPTGELIGDMQVAFNMDAENHTYVQEIWFKQAIQKVEITIGLQDLNVEFANSTCGALFLNSSFGILPVISNNFAAPLFPLTTLGLTTKWNINNKTTWINAVYDGAPTDFDYNPYNVRWQFVSMDGILAISEIQRHIKLMDLSGIYKIGLYAHSHIAGRLFDSSLPDSLNNDLIGLYAYVDQILWEQNNRQFAAFTQIGYSPSQESNNDFYLGLGINFTGLLSKKGNDVLGLGVAHEHFKNRPTSETAIELFYHYEVSKNIAIKPGFQYIIHPAGTEMQLNNSLVGSLWFCIHI